MATTYAPALLAVSYTPSPAKAGQTVKFQLYAADVPSGTVSVYWASNETQSGEK